MRDFIPANERKTRWWNRRHIASISILDNTIEIIRKDGVFASLTFPSAEEAAAFIRPYLPVEAPMTVWAVMYDNYIPSEVVSLWKTKEMAKAEAARLGDEYYVEEMEVQGD